MRYLVEINMVDDAFQEGGAAAELARILRSMAKLTEEEGLQSYTLLRDSNGNQVGKAELVWPDLRSTGQSVEASS